MVWWATPIAWTWHALIGTTVTVAIALMVAPLVPPSPPAPVAGAGVIVPAPLMPDPALAARVPAVEAVVRAALAAGTATCAVVEIGAADGVRGRVALGRLSSAAECRARRRRHDLRPGVADQDPRRRRCSRCASRTPDAAR